MQLRQSWRMKVNRSKINVGAAQVADPLDTPAQMAGFLQIAERTLIQNARAGKIPCVRLNKRVIRFHRGTVLASLMA